MKPGPVPFLRPAQRATVLLAFVAASTASLPGITACSGDADDGGPSTGGARVVLGTVVTSDAGEPFVTAAGWSVRLAKAWLSVGPRYYFGGEPILSLGSPARPPHREAWLPVAHAHPGHYVPGDALGESTGAAVLDLLAPATTLAPGAGVTGLYRSARFTFGPADDPRLLGSVVLLEGSAGKDGATILFRAQAPAPDGTTVEGCPLAAADVGGDGTVTLRVRTAVWLDQVDFAALPAGDGTSAVDLGATVAAHAFRRGLAKASAYTFTFSAPEDARP